MILITKSSKSEKPKEKVYIKQTQNKFSSLLDSDDYDESDDFDSDEKQDQISSDEKVDDTDSVDDDNDEKTDPKSFCEKSDLDETKKTFDLMYLIRLQNFNGYWEDLSNINALLGMNISKINGVDISDKEIANKCIATILALATLHVKVNEKRSLWKMIEIKAIEWIKDILPNADIIQLIKDTESLVVE